MTPDEQREYNAATLLVNSAGWRFLCKRAEEIKAGALTAALTTRGDKDKMVDALRRVQITNEFWEQITEAVQSAAAQR